MNYPDFSSHGYEVKRELGKNLTGGRITYQAKDINTGQTVVIKQFQFAQAMGTWRDYDAIHQEIKVLQRLNHSSIPRYLNSFDTSTGFCLVQEYKNAPSLAEFGYLNPEDIRQIAVQCLEILVYLQWQQPYIIHRDIKPENILLSQDKKVYLVDFGLAKLGEGEIASTIAKGTFGFMPPEQIHKRQLTKGTDLYSLGATLICLLTGTESINIGDLIDDNERIQFKSKLPKLSSAFVELLERMVERKLDKRFENALAALKALNSTKIYNIDNNVANVANVANVGKTVRFSPKLVKISTISLLTICVPILGLYQVNKHRQKQALVIRLQKTKACINCDLSGANLKGLFIENVNLQNANLKGANLSGAQLKGANLSFAKLQKSQLKGADLSGANLQKANLEDSNLYYANLIDANLENANLQGANLESASSKYVNLGNANLKNADLSRAGLNNAYLENANLQGATLRKTKLDKANLENSNLQGAKLRGADLKNANLKNANLKNANLQNVDVSIKEYSRTSLWKANLENSNLQGAKLRGADLKNANLKNADLTNADFSGTDLKGANLDSAKTIGANFEYSRR